jgi:hypothetical protein
MSDEPIKVLGCIVDFHDDKKQKHQSHEASINSRANATDLNGYGSIEATGYGATKEEALKDLRTIVDRLINA